MGTALLACVYVTDRGFLPCTCFSIATLAATASLPLRIFVLHTGLSATDLAEAQTWLAARSITIETVAIPDGEFTGLRRPASLPHATYGRLLMHKLLPDDLERVVYIDGDTLIDQDIAPLASVDLDGRTLGAVLDVGRILVGRREEGQRRLDLGPNGDYFNAGVLVIDWPRWKSARVGEECLRLLAETPERFTQNDQCALNHVCRGDWQPLDLAWNFQPACVVYDDRPRALFHFLGGRKPWRTDHQRHPMRFVKRYADFYASSPWAAEFNPPRLPYLLKDALRLGGRAVLPRYWRNRSRYMRLTAPR